MGTRRLVFLRTDGNSTIATGHLMRCLSIAQACLKAGMQVCFLVSDAESESLLADFLASAGTDCRILTVPGADYRNLNAELPNLPLLLSKVCHQTGISLRESVFFLDSYYVTQEYLQTLKGHLPTAYLDDLMLFDYDTDLVINYDIIPEDCLTNYQSAYQNAGQALLGGAYAPLRSQFQNRQALPHDTVNDILITTGGSDPYHFCLHFLEQWQNSNLSETKPVLVHIVIGRLYSDKEALYRLAKEHPFLRLHENVSDMATLLSSCDLAVSAAGTTLYELCALGIPAISFTMADNQIISAKAFAHALNGHSPIPYAGDIRTSKAETLQTILDFLTQMSNAKEKRLCQSNSMRKLVDGNGAARIADALLLL